MRFFACTLVVASLLAAGTAGQDQEALLRRGDVGAFVPGTFRARLSLSRGAEVATEVEIWRGGADRTLLRFLAEKERGKFLLRRGSDLWLLVPTASKPVRLGPSHRIYGAATIDVLFTLRLADDYRIESVESTPSAEGPLTTFELRARDNARQYAQVRYVVHAATAMPVSALYRLRSGREATLIRFREWSADRRYARLVEVVDLLRKGAATRIEVTAFVERAVPDGLFDLGDNTARQSLDRPDR